MRTAAASAAARDLTTRPLGPASERQRHRYQPNAQSRRRALRARSVPAGRFGHGDRAGHGSHGEAVIAMQGPPLDPPNRDNSVSQAFCLRTDGLSRPPDPASRDDTYFTHTRQCVVDSGIKGSSDVTTCSRLSESAGALEHSAGCPEGTPRGVDRVRDWSLM